jgi:hypothetical protein
MDGIADAPQQRGEGLAEGRIVVDDEKAFAHQRWDGTGGGGIVAIARVVFASDPGPTGKHAKAYDDATTIVTRTVRRILAFLLAFLTLAGPLASIARCANCCFGEWSLMAPRGVNGAKRGGSPAARERACCAAKRGSAKSGAVASARSRDSERRGAAEGERCNCCVNDPTREPGKATAAAAPLDLAPARIFTFDWAPAVATARASAVVRGGRDHAPPGFLALRC